MHKSLNNNFHDVLQYIIYIFSHNMVCKEYGVVYYQVCVYDNYVVTYIIQPVAFPALALFRALATSMRDAAHHLNIY